MRTIVLTGGGTGGHVMPHLALIPKLKSNFDKIIYIGTNAIEKQIITTQTNLEFFEISAPKFDRSKPLLLLTLPIKLSKSILQAKKILKKQKPCVIFSKGGYVSVPVVIAARLLKIPVVGHESDFSLGLANKIIYKFSSKFLTTFQQTAKNLKKAVYTGPPIRQELFFGIPQRAIQQFNLNTNLPTILIVGGSTGAKKINEVIEETGPEICKNYNIIHITGKGKQTKLNNKNYHQTEFCTNMQDVLSVADIIISRAGSNAIFEFLALNKLTILIPLPKGTSRGDQVQNANYFAKENYALVLPEEKLNKNSLINAIETLKQNSQKYMLAMKNNQIANGNDKIIQQIMFCTKN